MSGIKFLIITAEVLSFVTCVVFKMNSISKLKIELLFFCDSQR